MRSEMPKPGCKAGAPWQRTCPYCGVDINAAQVAHPGFCGADTCRQASLKALAEVLAWRKEAAFQADNQAARDDAATDIAALADAAGVAVTDVTVAVVPHQNFRIVPLPAHRREAFLSYLSGALTEAFSEPDLDFDPDDWTDRTSDEPEILSTACATCQGNCCRHGAGQNAFLQQHDLSILRCRHPDMTREAFLAFYAAALPAESVEESCVFHGAQGCVLPREMRSNTCNRFHCRSLDDLKALRAERPGAVTAIVGRDGPSARAVSGYRDGQGGWVQRPPGPPVPND